MHCYEFIGEEDERRIWESGQGGDEHLGVL